MTSASRRRLAGVAAAAVLALAGSALVLLQPPEGPSLFARGRPVLELRDGLAGSHLSAGWQVVVPPADEAGPGSAAREIDLPPGRWYALALRLGEPGGRVEVDSGGERALAAPVRASETLRRYAFFHGAAQGAVRLRLLNDSPSPLPVLELAVRRTGRAYGVVRGLLVLVLAASGLVLAAIAGGRDAVVALLLAWAAMAVYRQLELPARVSFDSDNLYYVPAALSLVREGDVELSELHGVPGFDRPGYRLVRRPAGTYNRYPVGVSVTVAPVVAVADLAYRAVEEPVRRAAEVSDLTADLLAAAAVGLLFFAARRIGASTWAAVGLAAVFAFATPHLPIHAGGLWSHNVSLLLLVAALWLLVREGRTAWVAGFAVGLAAVSRPTSLVLGGALGLYALRHRPGRDLAAFLVGLSLPLLALAAWSSTTFGTAAPPYAASHARFLDLANVPGALAGLLVSPNRGLLVFAPVFAFAAVGAWRALRRPGRFHPVLPYLAAGCGAYVLALATFDRWWGGGSYGPRLLVETVPFLVLLLYPALAAAGEASVEAAGGRRRAVRRLFAAAFAATLAFSAFTAWRGATSEAVYQWNRWPRPVDYNRWRLWDWSDLQIFRQPPDERPAAERTPPGGDGL